MNEIEKLQAKLSETQAKLDQWKRFAQSLWSDAQVMASDLGDGEELFESHGYEAQALGLPCDFEPEDEDE